MKKEQLAILINNYWKRVLSFRFKGKRDKVYVRGLVEAILEDVNTGERRIFKTHNIVTNDGDTYYAQLGAGEAATNDYTGASAGMRLGSAVTAVTKADTDVTTFLAGTGKANFTGYPKTNDTYGSGGGVDKRTDRYFYDTAEANGVDIKEAAIVNNITTPTSALCHFLFAATINKSASQTLTILVHHEFLGV